MATVTAPLQRLLGQARCVAQLRALCSLAPCGSRSRWAPQQLDLQRREQGPAAAAAARRRRRLPLHLAASYSVVSGEGGSSGGGGSEQQPWRLIIYSKEGCHLCDGLKDKVEAVLERAEFLPSVFSAAELEVRDITSRPEWEEKYAMTIPVLAAAAADGSGEVALPRPSPRFSADALQRHIEKHLGLLQQQQQQA